MQEMLGDDRHSVLRARQGRAAMAEARGQVGTNGVGTNRVGRLRISAIRFSALGMRSVGLDAERIEQRLQRKDWKQLMRRRGINLETSVARTRQAGRDQRGLS